MLTLIPKNMNNNVNNKHVKERLQCKLYCKRMQYKRKLYRNTSKSVTRYLSV